MGGHIIVLALGCRKPLVNIGRAILSSVALVMCPLCVTYLDG